MNLYKFNIIAFLDTVEACCSSYGDRQWGLAGA